LGAFFACGGTAVTGGDGGHDAGKDVGEAGLTDMGLDIPIIPGNDGGLQCAITGSTTNPQFDPVAYCVLRSVLQEQHKDAFNPKTGTLSSWDFATLLHVPGGAPVHDIRNDAAYASSCATFYQWSQLYADSMEGFDGVDGGSATEDLVALTPLLEEELATLPLDYDGQLYFDLRNFGVGLKYLSDNINSAKIDKIAFTYGRQIFTSFTFALPLAGFGDAGREGGGMEGGAPDGSVEGGSPTDGGGSDAGGDPVATGDGIIGVNQEPSTGTQGILYQPDKVVRAAYALFDLANANPSDPDAAKWVMAARRALDHIHDKARDPASGLYQASLLTTGSSRDVLGTLTTPGNLLSSDVQASIILNLIRAQRLVTASTQPADGGLDNPDVAVPLDAALTGVLASMGSFPFLTRADALIAAMDALWDGAPFEGGAASQGYIDGLVPSTGKTIRTKSSGPNASMFAALHLQLFLEGTAARVSKLNTLRVLLVNELPLMPMNPGVNTGLFTVVADQVGYFDTVSPSFELLGDAGTPPQSYTAPAAAAVIAGFNEQLVGFQQ
jgi:hypothetical protein